MIPQNLVSIILVVAALVWFSVKQTTWSPVSPDRLFRGPLILGIIGAVMVVSNGQAAAFDATDIALLLLELVAGAVVGAVIGLVAHLRPLSAEGRRSWEARNTRRPGAVEPRFEARNGWLGLTLWLALIAARIGFTFWESSMGGHLAQAGGVILLLLAANRAVRSAVILWRAPRVLSATRA
ncbi:hypothetical protein ACFJGV_00390 [Cnuibacter sp. UC19_7]|uniref:hypothetical protein n=1 Tax=Cnuibacter sp. UC19_7 TaxID=3350166 RepID=UPI003670BA58